MRLELEQHLEQAVRDGKSLEAVVGPNALAFAESWARETPHQFSRGFTIILRWLVFDWLTYALLFLSLIALFEHLVLLSPSFPFSLVHVVSTIAQICRQTWTKAVSLALKGSSLSAFLLYAERLSLQVMSVRCYRLKRHPFGPSIAPPP
jgi:hypothetical protein